jgi:hypothetical protein
MKTIRSAFVLSLGLVLALLVALPVAAAPPVVETGTYDHIWNPFGEFRDGICPGIEVLDHEVGAYRTTSFYDNEGNLLRVQTKYVGTDNLYNPANPGVVLSGHYAASTEYDARTGEVTGQGVPIHVTVPGYGTVMLRAGRWSPWPDHTAGKDSYASSTDLEQLCSCLAGN